MSGAQDRERVPGFVHGWGSILFKCGDRRINGQTKIGYGDKRTRGKGYGHGRHNAPTRRTAGQYETEAVTSELYKETAQAVRDMLAEAAADGVSYGNTQVDLEFIASEFGSADIMVELHDAVIVGDKSDHSVGPEGLMDQLEWDIMKIIRDGKTLFDATEGQP